MTRRDAHWKARRDATDAVIRRMWPAHSSVAIAAALNNGTDPGAIRGRAARMGLPPRKAGRPELVPTTPMDLSGRRARHGTPHAFRLGCHCADCITAYRTAEQARNARRRKPAPAPTTVVLVRQGTGHGSLARFLAGCDCDQCQRAKVAREEELTRPQPHAWRCPCDAWRINRGSVCGSCGQAPPWMAAGNNELQGAG